MASVLETGRGVGREGRMHMRPEHLRIYAEVKEHEEKLAIVRIASMHDFRTEEDRKPRNPNGQLGFQRCNGDK
jgi:hypothetical protein